MVSERVTHDELQRDLGRVEGRMEAMEAGRRARDGVVDDRLDRIEAASETVRRDVAEMKEMLAQGKGGWRVIAAAAGIFGMIAGWIGPTLAKKLFGG